MVSKRNCIDTADILYEYPHSGRAGTKGIVLFDEYIYCYIQGYQDDVFLKDILETIF